MTKQRRATPATQSDRVTEAISWTGGSSPPLITPLFVAFYPGKSPRRCYHREGKELTRRPMRNERASFAIGNAIEKLREGWKNCDSPRTVDGTDLKVTNKECKTSTLIGTPAHNRNRSRRDGDRHKRIYQSVVILSTPARLCATRIGKKIMLGRPCSHLSALIETPIPVYASSLYVHTILSNRVRRGGGIESRMVEVLAERT